LGKDVYIINDELLTNLQKLLVKCFTEDRVF